MSYSPLERGQHPVGVRTETWIDAENGNDYVVEIYYPAHASLQGKDLDPATQDEFENLWVAGSYLKQSALRDVAAASGEFPLIINMHGWAGFRREFTYLSTHLASHGYLVVSPDVPHSHSQFVMDFFAQPEIVGKPEVLHAHTKQLRETRYTGVPFLVQQGIERLPVKDEAIGFTGPSFGGWTALIAPRLDPRIRAAVAQCPAGGNMYIHGTRQDAGDISHGAPTMMLVATRDTLVPLFGQFDIYHDLTENARQMVALLDADHVHFGDDIEGSHNWLHDFLQHISDIWGEKSDWDIPVRLMRPFEELAPAAPTNDLWRMCTLAHFDAHLKNAPAAREFIDRGLNRRLEAVTGLKTVTVMD